MKQENLVIVWVIDTEMFSRLIYIHPEHFKIFLREGGVIQLVDELGVLEMVVKAEGRSIVYEGLLGRHGRSLAKDVL